jgi:membrane associated rhomboid family serine protease
LSTLVRDEVRALRRAAGSNARVLAGLSGVLWAVELVDLLARGALDGFGVVPRTQAGLAGILCAPFLHDGFWHLLMNTLGLWLFGGLSMLRRQRDFWRVALVSALTGGLTAWLLGGPGTVHIGASGVVFGCIGFVLGRGLFERSLGPILVALGVLWFAGSTLLGLVPGLNPGISWQAHLGGFLGGLWVARIGRRA